MAGGGSGRTRVRGGGLVAARGRPAQLDPSQVGGDVRDTVESERGSRRSRKSRASDSSRRASSDHASAATEDFSQRETLPEEEEIGPGAPFPETMEEREARLLRKLNASMENTMRYWAKDADTVPVPEFLRDDLDPNARGLVFHRGRRVHGHRRRR